MKSFLSGMTLVMAMAAPVAAETRYDRNLEKAVMDIVASKMGNIRGGFSYKQVPQMVVLPGGEPVAAEPRSQASNDDGLMPAVERPASRTVF
ncbi:hypothetical protein [Mesorhizobium sp. WSM4906]|uniref:hypothetical protein n=1 Tax=Mesorhizobium sp. WSM4906 TaxID=3038546 RepID=UPI002416DD12|nr:hypothetical protein [Mesorhizobium sp. WSM4906]WFP75627.1 hypothetical protein QAZ22_28635 [Mesorhizobium sp. WSM4906]